MRGWLEEAAAQRLLLTTPSVLLGERLAVYRVEGTTQWYSAFIIAHNQTSGEFTVTDDTVLEEHLESPELVQMRILGEGVGRQRRSRASASRLPARVERKRRSVSATNTGRGNVSDSQTKSMSPESWENKLLLLLLIKGWIESSSPVLQIFSPTRNSWRLIDVGGEDIWSDARWAEVAEPRLPNL